MPGEQLIAFSPPTSSNTDYDYADGATNSSIFDLCDIDKTCAWRTLTTTREYSILCIAAIRLFITEKPTFAGVTKASDGDIALLAGKGLKGFILRYAFGLGQEDKGFVDGWSDLDAMRHFVRLVRLVRYIHGKKIGMELGEELEEENEQLGHGLWA